MYKTSIFLRNVIAGAICLAGFLSVNNVLAQSFESNGILYERIGTTFEARVMSLSVPNAPSNLVIPSEVMTLGDGGTMLMLQVTTIDNHAFDGVAAIRELTLPATITSIGKSAFANNPLPSVTYLGTIEPSIAPLAFDMISVRTVHLPNASGGFTPELWGVTAVQMHYGQEPPEPPTEFTIITPLPTTSFSAAGGSEQFVFYSPVAWTASVTPSTGLTLGLTSGQAGTYATEMITVQTNQTTAARTFTIVFANGSTELYRLIITQAGTQQIIYGCTDPYAENYNPNANMDDGSCTYKKIGDTISGCMDSLALNYNPLATISDSSCIYPSQEPQVIYGCTDPKSLNYNPRATEYDGSCVYADEENIFNAESEETPIDTIGTKPIENCALSIHVAIIDVSISRVDVLSPNEVKVYWVIELEGGITILYSANYEVSQSGVTLFYLSIICKEEREDGAPIRKASGTDIVGFTVSATYNVDLGTNGICLPKETANFVVFPNPAKNTVNVQLEKHTNATLTLFDMNGKVVLSQAVNGDFAQINISSLSAGNYVLRLVENGQVSAGVKIVKE